jgi:SAM-dependent methyltransferase
MSLAEHWGNVFQTKPRTDVSWFEAEPRTSLELVKAVTTPSAAVIDIGAGTADLARWLIDDGCTDVTVLDISVIAIDSMAASFADVDDKPDFVVADVTKWTPSLAQSIPEVLRSSERSPKTAPNNARESPSPGTRPNQLPICSERISS